MPLVTNKKEVLEIYGEAERNGWVLPCFCSENLTTTEAILAASKAFGERMAHPYLPVIVAMTCRYSHRPQATYYTHTRRWDIGLKLFLQDLKTLTDGGTPYEKLRIMVHLDHVQFDDDKELLTWDMDAFSSIMFDASTLPLEENTKLTRQFVKDQVVHIVIEGACDEIMDATGEVRSELTTAEKAEKYFNETGVDMIVANLGTEHRASGKDLKYYGDYAKRIKEKIGNRIVLHGASSVPGDQIANLAGDGICKVNLWTALERDSTPVLFRSMIEHASKVAGREMAADLIQKELLGPACMADEKASLDYFTTVYRQDIIYAEMIKIVDSYLNLWFH